MTLTSSLTVVAGARRPSSTSTASSARSMTTTLRCAPPPISLTTASGCCSSVSRSTRMTSGWCASTQRYTASADLAIATTSRSSRCARLRMALTKADRLDQISSRQRIVGLLSISTIDECTGVSNRCLEQCGGGSLRRASGSFGVRFGWGDDTFPEGVHDRLDTILQMEFLEDVPQVVLHGVFSDLEVPRDLFVGVSPGHELEHLPLAGRQRRARSRRGGGKFMKDLG